jgi:hypothetical protein
MAILGEYALKEYTKISCSDFDGKHKATIRRIKSGTFSNSGDAEYATGENGMKLAAFSTNKAANFKAQSGVISDAGFILNGANIEELTNATGYQWEEVIRLESTTTATLKHKASGTAGSEIGYIYKCDSSGIIDPEKIYEQGSAASATAFAYADKVITLPTSVFSVGDYILVKYMPTYSKITSISRKTNSEPFFGEIRISAFVTKICDGTIRKGQFYIPRGRFDGNFDLAGGDSAVVQDFNIESLPGCDEDGDFWKFLVGSDGDIIDE